MEKGDHFIFYGKSNVVKGTVSERYEKITYDISHGVKVIVGYIVSNNGDVFRENLCLKIKSEIKPNILRKLINRIRF